MPKKTKQNWEKRFEELKVDRYLPLIKQFIFQKLENQAEDLEIQHLKELKEEIQQVKKETAEEILEEQLLDQLYRFEGIMGKYNCQHGGTKCEFQTNFHHLIRKEIQNLKKSPRIIN